jgi:hypothetical protein
LDFFSSSSFALIFFIASASKSCLSHFEKLLNASFFGLSESAGMPMLIDGRKEDARRRIVAEEVRAAVPLLLVSDWDRPEGPIEWRCGEAEGEVVEDQRRFLPVPGPEASKGNTN